VSVPSPHRPQTRAVHLGSDSGPVSTPIIHSATFRSDRVEQMLDQQERGAAGAFYQRIGHPTLHAVEQQLAQLEGADAALLFGSGMAALTTAFLSILQPGDHVVALRQCYGGTLEALRWGGERLGWMSTLVDARTPSRWEAAFTARTRVFHVESPTNPALSVVDLASAAEIARRRGALLTVDNTFASPVGQRPLDFGADLVIYSATKSIGGHGDLLAGAVLGSRERMEQVWKARVIFGGLCDPNTAWLIERSSRTLPLRVERANANALELARRLSRQRSVGRVHYPGLGDHPGHAIATRQMRLGYGPIVALELAGEAQARAFAERLELFGIGPSLGGLESLVGLPALTSHRGLSPAERTEAGIPDGMVRLSVGIEDVEDLWFDIERALDVCRVPATGVLGR
jgi:cystathionine beta-lyase/cystathionine gamma-synthase